MSSPPALSGVGRRHAHVINETTSQFGGVSQRTAFHMHRYYRSRPRLPLHVAAVLLCVTLLSVSHQCTAWWVGSETADCADGDIDCIVAQREQSADSRQGQQAAKEDPPPVDETDTEALKAELERLRAEVISLRSELVRKHQITESLAGALQELRAELRESEGQCNSHCASALEKQGAQQEMAPSEAHDARATSTGSPRGAERQHIEVNGDREDEDGQTEWVYGVPDGQRKIVIELGANNGEWISQFLQLHPDFWPIIVEAQPSFKDELRGIAQAFKGIYLQRAAWVTEGDAMTFHAHSDAGGMGSSLFGDSVYSDGFCDGQLNCEQSLGEQYQVTTLDIVALIRRVATPDDFIVLRMDIEGAEYQVARRLVLSGVACWVNNWEFEGHAMYAKSNHKYRPVDGVLPWLLRGCGVMMNVYQYYRVDPKLKELREKLEAEDSCAWLRFGVDGCSEAGSCGGIAE